MLFLWQSFFTRWWQEQTEEIKDLVRKLVDNGQLDFVNGGYVQHDEAAAHYVAMIDQTTLGHRYLLLSQTAGLPSYMSIVTPLALQQKFQMLYLPEPSSGL